MKKFLSTFAALALVLSASYTFAQEDANATDVADQVAAAATVADGDGAPAAAEIAPIAEPNDGCIAPCGPVGPCDPVCGPTCGPVCKPVCFQPFKKLRARFQFCAAPCGPAPSRPGVDLCGPGGKTCDPDVKP